MGISAHADEFTRRNLPPPALWPQFTSGIEAYPDRLNAAVELTDAMVEKGFGDRTALIGQGRARTYSELTLWSNQLANALQREYGVRPGERVMIRSANNPAMVACWLAVTKVGAVAVNTMPMLRAKELQQVIDKASVTLVLCDARLLEELSTCVDVSGQAVRVVAFDGTASQEEALDRAALAQPGVFNALATSQDDVALLGFTSGTTGQPKATVHFHRDLLAVCDSYAKEVLQVQSTDVFVGSPPLAFTFGLGGLTLFPLRYGACAVLLENASPPNLIDIIQRYKATICFTSPTAYRAMLAAMDTGVDLSSLRVAVSAGETLPAPTYNDWLAKTGKPMLDGIGSTEMLHIFISNRLNDSKPGCTGKPVTGYEAKILGKDGQEAPIGQPGALAVRGLTGCRYLDDPRQAKYVQNGWNITGDTFYQDDQGYFYFVARNDDMIISGGYNISGPEVEAALMSHEAVAECAVVASPDEARGSLVCAHVVLRNGWTDSDATTKVLQEHVKATIAPYKYPRRIVFTAALPKTATGKIQRFVLRQLEAKS
ncbi:MAG: AMP-binding protein [Burkholderiaceae bacterium]